MVIAFFFGNFINEENNERMWQYANVKMKEMKNKEDKTCKKQRSSERRVANWLRFALPNVVCQVLLLVMPERSEASDNEDPSFLGMTEENKK
ncbi:hypothetical protein GGR21_001391 [Dysgonomonas hofstadii]|uniref:Uncharacterized protein n=1 Tax=Dysgonomonas hofstadii TaxID=637886 RepID=A0A840CN70_9BACT|nr:hypothetical protein [Dysgonomonas hofstadii]MBB4035498.1 hypothetical protein [Dysgonomonas hofstadii]